jgi:phosphoenolpyruvate---glycerone phosphotransferase subunit DhaL
LARVDDTRQAIARVAQRVGRDADRLRELDAAVGDGDLGVTVGSGCDAVLNALSAGRSETFGQLFALVGSSFAAANPSTMANLIGAAMRRVSRRAGDLDELQPAAWAGLLDTAAEAIATRGGATLGDKTILDALAGSQQRLAAMPADATAAELATAARAGAEDAAAAIVPLTARAGRASWQGDRTRGLPDPGAELWVCIASAIESVCRGEPERS